MFIESSIANFPFNFVYIIYLLFFSKQFGVYGLMIAGVLAVMTQIFVQLPGLKKTNYKYTPLFDLKDDYFKKTMNMMLPVFISVTINDINVIIDRTLASTLDVGSISALNYSNKLNGLVLGVFISAITTVIFPLLSNEANRDNIDGVKNTMGYGINLILFITIPATVGLIVLANPIIEIAFQRGKFDIVATLMTSRALIFYSIGLVAMALRSLLYRVYYSLQDTKTPMINGVISVVLNIILNFVLVKLMDYAGLALATSVATIIATIVLLYGLRKKVGSLGIKGYIITFMKTGLASSIMGLVAYLVYNGLYETLEVSKIYNLISLLVAVGLGVIVYGVLCYVFNVEEVRNIVNKVIGR